MKVLGNSLQNVFYIDRAFTVLDHNAVKNISITLNRILFFFHVTYIQVCTGTK